MKPLVLDVPLGSALAEETLSLEELAARLESTPERVRGLTNIGLLGFVEEQGARRVPLRTLQAFQKRSDELLEASRKSALRRFFRELYDEGIYDYNGEESPEKLAEA